MRWFRYSDKEGAGVSKDEPEKKGFALFFHIVKENIFALVLLNIFFVLCCVPVVTIGPAFKALDKVTMNLVRNEPTSLVRDFFDEFKNDFLKSMLIGLVFMVLLALVAAAFILLPIGQSETGIYVTSGIALIVFLFIMAVATYIFKSLGTIDLPIVTSVKNALLLTLVSIKELVLMFVLTIVPSFLIANIIYVGVPLFLLWMFAYNSLVTSLISWNVIKKYTVLTDEGTGEEVEG